MNIFRSASGLWSTTGWCLPAFNCFHGCWRPLQAPRPPHRFRPALNIANMMNPIILGMGNAIPQVAAQAYRTGGVIGASRAAYRYVLFGLAPILVISAAAFLMPDLLLRTVYGPSSPYLTVGLCLQVLAVAGVLEYIAEMISKTLLGVEAGRLASLVNVVAFGVVAVLAFALIGPFGVFGACLALLIANLVRAISAVIAIAWLICRRKSRASARSADSPAGSIEQGPRHCCGTEASQSRPCPHNRNDDGHTEKESSARRSHGATGISRCSRSCCWVMP